MSIWRTRSLRRPAVAGVLGLLPAAATLRLDAWLPSGWLFGLQPPTAGTRAVLGAVLSSVLTVSALVFWVRGMFVQLSAGQFSSRVLRWYLADNYQQQVLDFLVGVFGYVAGVTLTLGGDPTAPALSTVVAVSLSLCALIVVIATITDSARATELTGVLAQIAEQTIRAVRNTHPERGTGVTHRSDSSARDATRSGDRLLVRAPASGWVGLIDDARVAATLPADTTVRIRTRAGTFVLLTASSAMSTPMVTSIRPQSPTRSTSAAPARSPTTSSSGCGNSSTSRCRRWPWARATPPVATRRSTTSPCRARDPAARPPGRRVRRTRWPTGRAHGGTHVRGLRVDGEIVTDDAVDAAARAVSQDTFDEILVSTPPPGGSQLLNRI